MLVSVPELTRSADIKLNTRLRLPPAVAIVSSPQLRGVPTAIHRIRAIRGRHLTQEGWRPRPIVLWTESSITRRRSLILSIVTAGCWIILLAIVLSSVFEASTLTKQTRDKDRQSAQPR